MVNSLHGMGGPAYELQGKSFCSDISGTSSPPPSSLTLVSAELFLSLHLIPLSTLLFHCEIFFPPFLKYVIT